MNPNVNRTARTLIAALGLSLCVPAFAAEPETPFELQLEQDDVKVSTRSNPNWPYAELQAIAEINAPPSEVVAAYADIGGYTAWRPHMVVADVIKKEGDTFWYRGVADPPVVSRRDMVMRLKFSSLGEERYGIEFHSEPTAAPEQEGVVRVKKSDGSWLFEPLDGGKRTRITYRILTEPGGNVPAWMFNRTSVRGLPGIFTGLRKLLASGKFSGKRYAFTAR